MWMHTFEGLISGSNVQAVTSFKCLLYDLAWVISMQNQYQTVYLACVGYYELYTFDLINTFYFIF